MNNNFERVYYENPALWVPERFGRLVNERINLVLAWMPPSVNSVLDLGCGNGVFANRFLSNNTIRSAVGVDRSFTALKQVRVDRSQADITQLPFGDESFDFVAAMEVIEHLPYIMYKNGLTEIARVAKKFILITVPYKEDRYFKQVTCPECGCVFHPDYHARSYNEADMRSLFENLARVLPLKIQGIVTVEEISMPRLWKAVRKAYLRGRDFPSRALCPQCGYSENSSIRYNDLSKEALANDGIKVGNWKSLVRTFWPKHTTFCWWMALYAKEN